MNLAYVWGLFASLLTSLISLFFRWENKEDRLKKHRKISNFFAVLSVLPLVVVSFAKLNSIAISYSQYEPVYFALVKLFELFSNNYNIFFGILSSITVSIYCWIIYKESENPTFSLILFFLSFELFELSNNIKLFLSIAVLITAIPLVKKGGKNWIFVSLITLIAIGIDNSAIGVIPLYLIYLWTPQAWISGFIILAMYPLGEKFRIYVEQILNVNPTGFDISHFVLFLLSFVLLMVVIGKIEKKKLNTRFLYCSSIFGMGSLLFSATTIPSPLLIVYLPSVIKKIKTTWVRYFVYFLVLFVFVGSFIFVSIQKSFNLLSYETFLTF